MYKKLIISLCASIFVFNAFSQSNGLSNVTRDMINLDGMRVSNVQNIAFFGIKGPKGDVVGDPYLDSTWQAGSIKLFQKIGPPGKEGDSIGVVPIRLDLLANEVEVKIPTSKEIRAVSGHQVRFFFLEGVEQRIFMNVKQFRSEDKIEGFVELIKSGRISLVEHVKLNIIKPTYNEALGTGSKDTKIAKSSQYYAVKGNTLFQIGASKKKLLSAMADRADDVEKFIKTNDLSLKSRTDMAKIFAYYSTL